MTTMEIVLLVVWYLTGVYGYYYNWTREYDLETKNLPPMILSAFGGPITALVCWLVMGSSKTVFKKRRQKECSGNSGPIDLGTSYQDLKR